MVLFVVKYYVGLRTNSLCIYTDGINNLLDSLSIFIAFSGMFLVKKASTKKHPFGFGRVEYILEFIMSAIISLTGASFAYNSIVRLMMPTPVWFYEKYAFLIGISCVIKLCLGFFFLSRYKKTHSDILKTIMLDSFLDTGVTAVTLVSFTLTNKVGLAVDGFMGLIISVLIVVSGVKLICSSISKLIGTEDYNSIDCIKSIISNLDENISQKGISIYDYGTNAKDVLILLDDTQEINKKYVSSQIKSELKKQNFKNVYIEWEENNV